MTPRRPKNVVALTPGGNITIEQVLGWLAMFTVPDEPVTASRLLRTWAGNDLDTTLMPEARVPVNVFQVACRSVESRRRENGSAEVKVDEVYEDPDSCVYQVTRMVRDREHGMIEFEKSMRVKFDKHTAVISVDPLDKDAYKHLAGLEATIRERFDKLSNKVPGAKVRAAVRRYMGLLGGTNVRKKSGGVYFVPKGPAKHELASKKTLDTIASVLTDLYGGDAELWMIPLAADAGEKEMVEKHFDLNMDEQVEEQIGKIAAVLQRDSYVRKDLQRNVIENRRRLGELHARYKDLLGTALTDTHDKLGILDEQIEALLMKGEEAA